ncbi:MAG: acyltransferase [Lachnospiraceae bacterium]|nr:acyltransferase [Lachnospiraceae bacterium]
MKGTKLDEVCKDRNNNLDIIRFIAAIMVIVAHSFPLCYGYIDPLGKWTNGGLSIGGLAVGIFFVSGGFLISKSMERTQKAKIFFMARIKRILPELIIVVFICAFVLGPLVTDFSLKEYFTDIKTYKYLFNAILIPIYELPGVFENNVYSGIVNGSLWTLPVEFMCYIACYIFYRLHFLERKWYLRITIPAAVIFVICVMILFGNNGNIINIIRPVILFYIGMGLYVFRDKILFSNIKLCLYIGLFCIMVFFRFDIIAMLLCFPYIIFHLAYGTKIKFSNFTKYGEFSYGIYLWGMPVGQIICLIFNNIDWYANAILTAFVALLLAIIQGYVIKYGMNRNRRKKHG